MAKYTIELRTIIENNIPIFDFPYDYFNEDDRANFENKFIRHFYFREIGTETVDKFKFYLRDKMDTVFPYYNKLMQAAQVEYDLLDHYRLTETLEKQTDNKTKSLAENSAITQDFKNSSYETEQKVKTNNINNINETINSTNNVNAETTENTTQDYSNTHNKNNENNKTDNSTGKNINKFLDTPQGKLNLDDDSYLTELRQDETNNNLTSIENGTENFEQESTTETQFNKQNNETANGETQKTVYDSNNATGDTTNKGTQNDEQKSTQDSNFRGTTIDEQREVYTLTRAGNIGVQTDAEGIQKHVDLRKTLDKLLLMFFDECEDLFMLLF